MLTSAQGQSTWPRPSPEAVTIWSCSGVRTPGAHSALTGGLGICAFPWRGRALGQIHSGGGWEEIQVSYSKINPSHDTPKKVFNRTKENKVLFFHPHSQSLTLCPLLAAAWHICTQRLVTASTGRNSGWHLQRQLQGNQWLTIRSWDWSPQTPQCCSPRSGPMHWRHRLCSLPAAAGETAGAGRPTSLGWNWRQSNAAPVIAVVILCWSSSYFPLDSHALLTRLH